MICLCGSLCGSHTKSIACHMTMSGFWWTIAPPQASRPATWGQQNLLIVSWRTDGSSRKQQANVCVLDTELELCVSFACCHVSLRRPSCLCYLASQFRSVMARVRHWSSLDRMDIGKQYDYIPSWSEMAKGSVPYRIDGAKRAHGFIRDKFYVSLMIISLVMTQASAGTYAMINLEWNLPSIIHQNEQQSIKCGNTNWLSHHVTHAHEIPTTMTS